MRQANKIKGKKKHSNRKGSAQKLPLFLLPVVLFIYLCVVFIFCCFFFLPNKLRSVDMPHRTESRAELNRTKPSRAKSSRAKPNVFVTAAATAAAGSRRLVQPSFLVIWIAVDVDAAVAVALGVTRRCALMAQAQLLLSLHVPTTTVTTITTAITAENWTWNFSCVEASGRPLKPSLLTLRMRAA